VFFVASRSAFVGDRLASVTGEFMLRDVSRTVTLRALRISCRDDAEPVRDVCGGDFETAIDRSAFGVMFVLPLVANPVRVLVETETVRQ
jgi:polyisoprenoid-binding protein YceI